MDREETADVVVADAGIAVDAVPRVAALRQDGSKC